MKIASIWKKIRKNIAPTERSNQHAPSERKVYQILLLTNRDSDNVGDQVIEACDIALIKTVMKNLNIPSHDYKINSRAIGIVSPKYVATKNPALLNTAETAIKNTDIVFFGGAPVFNYQYQIFYEQTSVTLEIAQKYNKPVIFSAIGVEGYDENNKKCQRLKKNLNFDCVKQITTRDDFESLKKFKQNENMLIDKVSDPAVFTSKVFEGFKATPKANKKRTVGIFVLRSNGFTDNKIDFSRDEAAALWKSLAADLTEKGYNYEFLTSGHFGDEAFLDYLIREHGINIKKCVFNINSPEILIRKISSYDAVISCRLHPSIISFALDVPSVGIVWNSKVNGFYESIGYGDRIIDINGITSTKIIEKVESAIEQGINKDIDYLASVYNAMFYGFQKILRPEHSEFLPYSYEELLQNIPPYSGTTAGEQGEKLKRKFRRIYSTYNELFEKNMQYRKADKAASGSATKYCVQKTPDKKFCKILLLTNRDSDNVGDQVIEACDIALIKTVMKNLGSENYELNSRAASIVPQKYIATKDPALLKTAEDAIKNTDIVFLCGASMFNYQYQSSYERISVTLEIAQKYNKPIIFSVFDAEGYDENNKKCQRLKTALNFDCVKQITTRDDSNSPKEFKPNKDLLTDKVSDPAVFASEVFEEYRKTKQSKKKVGIFVLRSNGFKDNKIDFSRDDAARLWKSLATGLAEKGYDYEFLTSGHFGDEAFLDYLIREHGIAPNKCAFNINSPEALIGKISSYDAVVSCRLHPSIISFALNVPSIGIVWNSKVNGFYNVIGYEDRILDANNITADKIIEKVETAIASGIEKDEDYLTSVYRAMFDGFKKIVSPDQNELIPYTYAELIENIPSYPGTPRNEQSEKLRRKSRRTYEKYNELFGKNMLYKEEIRELKAALKQLQEDNPNTTK
ncbi:MAG: polysaccharide pyruvyl transferase family protein [Lachnospiraceae bacterium]|nr:polysaccharide pyruvyl transferase family protein [Lachnospiraceae bacterium]